MFSVCRMDQYWLWCFEKLHRPSHQNPLGHWQRVHKHGGQCGSSKCCHHSERILRTDETIRAFNASSAKNCYTLGPLTPNSTYTIRGTFLYDNYDNAPTLPTFQVAIGTTVVANVSFPDQYTLKYMEFTLMAMSDTIYYCLLADESLSTPFISALTVRPIDQTQVDEWYPSWNAPGWELSHGYIFRTKRRLNFGGNQILRYISCQLWALFWSLCIILRYAGAV